VDVVTSLLGKDILVAPNKIAATGIDITAYGWATADIDWGCMS